MLDPVQFSTTVKPAERRDETCDPCGDSLQDFVSILAEKPQTVSEPLTTMDQRLIPIAQPQASVMPPRTDTASIPFATAPFAPPAQNSRATDDGFAPDISLSQSPKSQPGLMTGTRIGWSTLETRSDGFAGPENTTSISAGTERPTSLMNLSEDVSDQAQMAGEHSMPSGPKANQAVGEALIGRPGLPAFPDLSSTGTDAPPPEPSRSEDAPHDPAPTGAAPIAESLTSNKADPSSLFDPSRALPDRGQFTSESGRNSPEHGPKAPLVASAAPLSADLQQGLQGAPNPSSASTNTPQVSGFSVGQVGVRSEASPFQHTSAGWDRITPSPPRAEANGEHPMRTAISAGALPDAANGTLQSLFLPETALSPPDLQTPASVQMLTPTSLSPSTSVPPGPQPSLVLQQIVPEFVSLSVGAGDAPIILHLRPEELGSLHFQLTRTPEGTHIHLMVEQPLTHELLRRHADELLAELHKAGFDGATFSYGGSGANGDPAPERGPPSQPEDLPPPSVSAKFVSPSTAVGRGNLDLRL